jgi:L-seryl-tRNA(Ser) seleniumtransferase
VNTLLEHESIVQLFEAHPRALVATAVRAAIDHVRGGAQPAPSTIDDWRQIIERTLARTARPSLRRVINASGVILHTNLGRAPLAGAAIDAIGVAAAGYTNLEYDVDSGARGSRMEHARALIIEMTGAEDALVVNNCAAALVLALRTFAGTRDVIVSRGELVEIGGSFRIPDIMAQAGVRLVEIGTTNRTNLDDYRRALGAPTGAIVKVHRSNFTMDGFVHEVSVAELVPVAREAGVPLIHDFGSGLLVDLAPWNLAGEPTARDVVGDGADVVVMSGDKLLGGPQAGIVLGRSSAIRAMKAHPLARALRVDKLTLAALEATLSLYRAPERAMREIPVLRMITERPDVVEERAKALSARLGAAGVAARVVLSTSTIGGGAFPASQLASCAVALRDAAKVERALRDAPVPVVARIANGEVLLDMRTVPDDDLDTLAASVMHAVRT